ncbi:MAG: disulfide bond formation protein B [Planctomycetales bacterium]
MRARPETKGLLSPPDRDSSWLTAAALAVSLATAAGSLWLSIGMDLKACPLCFYQRTFAISAAAVLGMGLVAGVRPAPSLSLLSLPLAGGGLGIALLHVSLEAGGKMECPAGIFGLGTAPQQALAALAILFAVLLADGLRGRKLGTFGAPAVIGGIVVGGALAFACVRSAPPMPPPPAAPYDRPPEICRPPYQPA